MMQMYKWKCLKVEGKGRSSGVELSTADPEPEEMLNMRGKHDNAMKGIDNILTMSGMGN